MNDEETINHLFKYYDGDELRQAVIEHVQGNAARAQSIIRELETKAIAVNEHAATFEDIGEQALQAIDYAHTLRKPAWVRNFLLGTHGDEHATIAKLRALLRATKEAPAELDERRRAAAEGRE